MTNEEAIKALELLLTAHLEGYETILDDNDVKALDLAISALSRDRWISVEEKSEEKSNGNV